MRDGICGNLLAVVLWTCIAGIAWPDESVIYVDAAATGANNGTSWIDAYVRLQDAFTDVAETSARVEIRIAQGIYRAGYGGPGSGPSTETFELRNHLTLAGGYAGVAGSDPDARDVDRYRTVLTGDLSDDDGDNSTEPPNLRDSSGIVVTGREIDETTVLDGLTITRGHRYGMELHQASPSLYRCRFVDNGFAGIYAWDCNSVISDCAFERNGLDVIARGGIDCVRGNLTLTDCAFVGNNGGGIDNSGTLDLLRCSFVANSAHGAAAIDHSRSLTARQCVFQSNRGGTGGAVDFRRTATLIDCEFTDNASDWGGAVRGAGDLTLVNCQFIGNSSDIFAAAVMISGDTLRAEGCLFAGNQSRRGAGAIFTPEVAIVRLSNCTFAGNRGWPNAVEYISLQGFVAELRQCIVRDGPDPFTKFEAFPSAIAVTYSNVEGGYEGQGNIDADPGFVDPGHRDDSGTPDDPNDDMWVNGDYHLKSQAGHWDRDSQSWVLDDLTSPCIDAGDPNAPLGNEPFPNGGFVNIGAYGATSEASRSYFGTPVCKNQLAADINGDCKVDDLDVDILLSHWLMDATLLENVPPSITLLSPTEGAEFTAGMSMVLRAEASDADGRVIRVEYTLRSQSENGSSVTGTGTADPTNNWEVTWDGWTRVMIAPGWTYTIQAEALDNEGAKTLTPEVEIKLNP